MANTPSNNIAIQLTNVSKKYEIHHEKPTLVEKFVKGKNETFWALKNINLAIKKGERVGIIGPNGSGKTTLLKMIAGITTPTHGTITTRGKIVSLIDLTAGFHSDLTGYQNIYLNGMLLGLSKHKIEKRISSIIAFADIRQFIDAPLFTYSNGMTLRLGFSIAIHSDPNILVLDEHLTVGDQYFQKRAKEALIQLNHKKITFIIVTHTANLAEMFCDRFIILRNGDIHNDGGHDVLTQYFSQ